MRFGKRKGPDDGPAGESPDATPSAAAQPAAEPEPFAPAAAPEPPPAAPAAEPDGVPYVEGEAVELPVEAPAGAGAADAPPAVAVPLPPVDEPPTHQPYVPPPYSPQPAPAGVFSESAAGAAPRRVPELPADLADRPEILVGAAFGSAFLLALVLRRLGN